MLLGDLPGTAGRWTGWRFHDGELTSPAGDTFTAGDVLSLRLLRQQLSARDGELARLRARLAIAEETLRQQGGVANSGQRYG